MHGLFSVTGGETGAIAENVTKVGDKLVFENFTIASTKGGLDLVGAARQIVALAEQQGARTLEFKAIIISPKLAAKFGVEVGTPAANITVTSEATFEGLMRTLRSLR